MKEFFKTTARLLAAGLLIALSVICLFGMLAYYQTLTALPFAIAAGVTFAGAVGIMCHEEGKSTAPLAPTKKTAATTDKVAAA